MTTYYIDADNGLDTNNGLGPDSAHATNKPFKTLDQFTENARSPGDIAILRRGTTAQYDDSTDLTFTSDGAIGNPIIIEADFDDPGWNGGPDFANSAQTFTMVFGSKTHTGSATITGIAVGDWVYNTTDGDDPRLFAYEVAAVSGTTLTLKLPFKGSAGSTKTLKVMPAVPVWNVLTGDFQINADTANFWEVQGLEATGTDANGVIEVDTTQGFVLIDCILKPDTNDSGVEFILDSHAIFRKCRIDGGSRSGTNGIAHSFNVGGKRRFYDCLIENCAKGYLNAGQNEYEFFDCEFTNNSTADILFENQSQQFNSRLRLRNCILGSTTKISGVEARTANEIFSEDHNGVVSATLQVGSISVDSTTPHIESETTTVRSGGSNISIKIIPSTKLSILGEFSKIKLFDIPIYATTASKTYDIYFKSNAIANWTANPTAAELFIELEAWGHASNNFRKITKSTGTLPFTTVTTWNKISVTVAPAQAGVAYLRGWYTKPKESAKTNEFFIDPLPVIT